MPNEEMTGKRELSYNNWHRPSSITPILTGSGYDFRTASAIADTLGAIDIDLVDYCRGCNMPLAFTETQKVSQGAPKNAVVTANVANALAVPAFSLSVPTAPISGFRQRTLTSHPSPLKGGERDWLSASAWLYWLIDLHVQHEAVCPSPRHPAMSELLRRRFSRTA